jgi:DNA-binding GntR family transcriptional regulator
VQVTYRDRMGDDLDHDSPVPLYEQLAALLRAGIESGGIGPRLPSEIALTQQYGVSRGTAHRAVMILVDAGYVRISRGKGTFVVPKGQR